MRLGVAFPTTEIGSRPEDIRAFARGAEALGFDYLTCIDHVIQSPEPVADDWRSYYTRENPFHEILTLFGFLAGVTERIELVTSILILPQRQTVLAAKQLAEIDVLSGGRLRAGVGIGWNAVEYEALGQRFRTRARRMEEQIALLRMLWTRELVTFDGEWDRVHEAGINPLPVQRPIPLWIGAFVPAALERAGRLADGLLLNPRIAPDDPITARSIDAFREAAAGAGREAGALGLEVTLFTRNRPPEALAAEYEAWRALGATHLTVRTMTAGLGAVEDHLRALEVARDALPVRLVSRDDASAE